MVDLQDRVRAIKSVLAAQASEQVEVKSALLGCLSDLQLAGEAAQGLELIEAYESARSRIEGELPGAARVLKVEFLRNLGRYADSLRLCTTLLQEQFPQFSEGDLAELRILRSANAWQLGDSQQAFQELLSIRKELLVRPDGLQLAKCALHLQACCLIEGRYGEARKWGLEAIVSARRADNRLVEALALDNIGRVEKNLCRWDLALDASEEACAAFHAMGNRLKEQAARRGRLVVLLKRGQLQDARTGAEECIRDAVALQSELEECFNRLLCALAALHQGDDLAARKHINFVLNVRHVRGERHVLLAQEYLGDLSFEAGDFAEALHVYGSAMDTAKAVAPRGDIVAELMRRRAECLLLMGNVEAAHAEALAALDLCRELSDRYEEAATYRVLALCSAELGNDVAAKEWFEQGFAYFEDIQTPYELGRLWIAYGEYLLRFSGTPDQDEVAQAFARGRELFATIGAMKKLADADRRVAELSRSGDTSISSRAAGISFRRRPSAELERRARWAREEFGTVTRHGPLLDLLEEVAKFARTDASILALGESGTGKELVAKGVHRLSGRRGQFVAINCAAMPRDIVESELFGHVAGSFTGAVRDKAGIFEECEHGTAFLDEIGEMSVDLQARFLRFLESGELRRVGSAKNRIVDARVVAATNRPRAELEGGKGFRQDLYYRLAHAVITLPPLRHRGDDVELLVQHFLEQWSKHHGKQVTLTEAAHDRLIHHPWPGNVRQLRSVIQRAVILAEPGGEIGPNDILLDECDVPVTLAEELDRAERRRVEEALRNANGSRTQAAKALGIPRTTLLNKMKRFGLA